MKYSVTRATLNRALLIAVACVAAIGALAGTASADPTVTVNSSSKALFVNGGSEASFVDVRFSAGQYIVQRSDGDMISGGSPCILIASNAVSCAYSGHTPPYISMNMGDGADLVTIDSTVPDHTTATVTDVYYVASESAPLSATINETGIYGGAVGGPLPDTINIDMPSACEVSMDGGGGDDHLSITAQTRDDTYELGCGTPSYITGGEGDDFINAEASKIDLEYQASAGHDVFTSGSGNDHITVGDGPDWAFGGAGNDRFYDNGGPDPSKLWGGPGADVFSDWDSDESDTTFFDGGSGVDVVSYHNINDNHDITVSLDGVANDGVPGETDNIHRSVERVGTDGVYNTSGQYRGDDTITGSSQPNSLYGRNGNDTIDGLAGQDDLRGGAGADSITGGSGPDLIYGESGNDEIFAEDGEVDVISCGGNTDIVHADPGDTVNADCETVL